MAATRSTPLHTHFSFSYMRRGGKANAAIIKLLSKSLGLSRGEIEIVSGQTAQLKVLLIHNLEIAELTGLLKPLGVPT